METMQQRKLDGVIQGYKELVADLSDKVADLRGEVNVRNGLVKDLQAEMQAKDELIEQQALLITELKRDEHRAGKGKTA